MSFFAIYQRFKKVFLLFIKETSQKHFYEISDKTKNNTILTMLLNFQEFALKPRNDQI